MVSTSCFGIVFCGQTPLHDIRCDDRGASAMNAILTDPCIRQRMVEFLGGESMENATALCMTHTDGCLFDRNELRPVSALDWFIEKDFDIARSLGDSESYLLHLDIEYVNFDSPAEAFLDPWRCFDLQESVIRVIETLLLDWGIRPLHLVTGQGHHFVWRIRRHGALAKRMAEYCPAPELIPLCMQRKPPLLAEAVTPTDQAVFAFLALLIEYVAHRIKERAASKTSVPVEITAVHVGPTATAHREMISIDISEYGDPLHARVIRIPFTNYRKPWATGMAEGLGLESQLPRFRTIPLHEMDVRQAIRLRQVDDDVRELARRACVRIPLQETGTEHLLEQYIGSRLRRFHEDYYSTQHDPPEQWHATYARTPVADLPGCVRHLLEWPNDWLLKPAGVQLLTRAMLAHDWHPRHIAGLIRSKYEDPRFCWTGGWQDYEPATRADFYTRLFAGLHLTGLDHLVDFNCKSTQEKQFCNSSSSRHCNLESLRQTLLHRQSRV